jgi:hypothetical protein
MATRAFGMGSPGGLEARPELAAAPGWLDLLGCVFGRATAALVTSPACPARGPPERTAGRSSGRDGSHRGSSPSIDVGRGECSRGADKGT